MSPAAARRLLLICATAAALTVTLGGCGEGPPRAPRDSTATDAPVPVPPEARGPDVRAAVTDLTERLGVGADAVQVVAFEDVMWNDGSRGCAKPGMNYTMSIVEGSRITLQVDGTTYEYHSGGSGPPVLCERPTQ